LNYPDGRVYEGKFKDNKPFGYGVRIWPDGKKYEGYWDDENASGKGKKIYPDGTFKTGKWVDNKFKEDKNINPETEKLLKQSQQEMENSKDRLDQMKQ